MPAFLAENSGGTYYVVAEDLTTAVTISDPDDVTALTSAGYETIALSSVLLATVRVIA
jgi:hypothetical protein